MRTRVTVAVDDILSLIHCAETYGYADDVFFDGMASMLNFELADEEIVAYGDDFLTAESVAAGYTEETRSEALAALREFKLRYIGGECNVVVPEDAPESEPDGVSPVERARILAADWKFVDRGGE